MHYLAGVMEDFSVALRRGDCFLRTWKSQGDRPAERNREFEARMAIINRTATAGQAHERDRNVRMEQASAWKPILNAIASNGAVDGSKIVKFCVEVGETAQDDRAGACRIQVVVQ